MIYYVPTSGGSVAQDLSESLWQLTLPQSAQKKSLTVALFPSIRLKDGSFWLVVNSETEILIHPEAKLGGVAEVLNPWIFEKLLPANTLTDLEALINSSKGKKLNVWSAFPALFKAQARTKEQLISLNLYPAP
jgi:hypothetical protein